MKNNEHLSILKQGVRTWNKWRAENPETKPVIDGATLSGTKLDGMDLSDANLIGCDLSSASLVGANLTRAIMAHANLKSAKCTGANLHYAELRFSRLEGADLRRATLTASTLINAVLNQADLSFADVTGANFTNALLKGTIMNNSIMGETAFVNNDLSTVRGLDSTQHQGPSVISLSTIYYSKGQISEIFLRGLGVQDNFIVFMRSLTEQPIQFYSCFISYSSKDAELAQRLYADLQSRGVRCWFAPEDLKIGERFRRRIDEVIRVYDRLLLILSENSVASSWVEKEVETAMESEDEQKRTLLFPVRLDDSVMEIKTGWPADVRRTRHIGDFRKWKEHDEYQKAFARLLDDLKASV